MQNEARFDYAERGGSGQDVKEEDEVNFRDYKVWQDAVAYATEVYKVTAGLPYLAMLTLVATRQY